MVPSTGNCQNQGSKADLATLGREIYPGLRVQLWHSPNEVFNPDPGAGQRFRLVLVEHGTGILGLGKRRLAFISPALFCLNEQERPELEQNLELKAQALYFHPDVINSSFNFKNVRQVLQTSDYTHEQDRQWLRAFLDRSNGHDGCLSLGPVTAGKIKRQIAAVGEELAAQRDGYWPCRSRSLFLEVLFLVDRLYEQAGSVETDALAETNSTYDVESIILYLHTHYGEKLSLKSLSMTFHTNRTTLTEQFRAVTGQPVMSYLAYIRMRLASLMFRDTTVPVTEVMERVGFNDRTHFGRTFRKYLGYSPSEYRQRYCWMLQ